MSELYNIPVKKFIQAASLRSIGILVGSVLGAVVVDKFRVKADLALFLSNLFGGIFVVAVPWSPNGVTMAIILFLNGLCHGVLNNSKY